MEQGFSAGGIILLGLRPHRQFNPEFFTAADGHLIDQQWRNYERRSKAIASGRQAAGSTRVEAFGRRIVCFALQNSAEFLKRERS